MANPITPLNAGWIEVPAGTLPAGCRCKYDNGQTVLCGQDPNCGSKCFSRTVNKKTEYRCLARGFVPEDMSADDVSRPATQAAFVDQTGSPQFDAFEGGKFDPYAYAGPFTDTYITTVNDSLCRCGTNIGCGGNCACNRGGACYCWVVQIYKRSNDGKPGVWSAPTYLCAQTAAIAFSTFNARQGRTRGIPNLFDNFPISHPLNNNPIS